VLALTCWLAIPLGCVAVLGDGPAGLLLAVALGACAYAAGCWRWRGALRLDSLRRRSPIEAPATRTMVPTEG
jgi:hypothetical protein